MEQATIYVELFDEGVRVFAPVPALYLGERYYKILEHNREGDETLRFNSGTYVFCLLSKFSANENLVPVAYCEVSEQEVQSLVSNTIKE